MVVAENGLIPLDEAYERCRCETEEWAKTFYLGTMLMPPENGGRFGRSMSGVVAQTKSWTVLKR